MTRKKFKIGEAADKLGLTVEALRRLADQGKIHCTYNRGGQRLFTAHALSVFRRNEYRGTPRRSVAELGMPLEDDEAMDDEDAVEFDPDDPDTWPSDAPDDGDTLPVVRPVRPSLAWTPPPAPPPRVAPQAPEPSDDERLAEIKRDAMQWVPARPHQSGTARGARGPSRSSRVSRAFHGSDLASADPTTGSPA